MLVFFKQKKIKIKDMNNKMAINMYPSKKENEYRTQKCTNI